MRSHADAEQDRPAELTPPIRPVAPWRVAKVAVLPDLRLRVRFNDGTEGVVDLAAFVRSAAAGVFAALRDENVFAQARIEIGAVTWPGGIDLAPDAMYRAIKQHGTWVME
jgi:Protein of unknown function (DUF2442)